MNVQIHTFELVIQLSGNAYRLLRNSFFEDAKGRKRWCYLNPGSSRIIYTRWRDIGLIIYLNCHCGESSAFYLHLRINPSKLLGNSDALALFEPTEDSISELIPQLQICLDSYPIELSVQQASLFRIDLCRNILVQSQEIIYEYLRLLKKGAKRYNWEENLFYDGRDAHSFRRSNCRYQVTVYDKLYQIQEEDLTTLWDSPYKILRVEASLLSDGIRHVCRKHDFYDDNWTECFRFLCSIRELTIVEVLSKVISPGDYYSLQEAVCQLYESGKSYKKLDRLHSFLKDINRSKIVDVQAISNNREYINGKKRLRQLCRRNINPVTIEARAGIDHLPSLLTADDIIL